MDSSEKSPSISLPNSMSTPANATGERPSSLNRILHVSPTYYSTDSVIGGGEKYVIYMCRAIQQAAPLLNLSVENKVVAFGDLPGLYNIGTGIQCEVLPGRPWDPYSVSPRNLSDRLKQADIVLIHQCLSAFGLFVASHAIILNKMVVGMDHGGGEHPLVHLAPRVGRLFHLLHAYSQFGSSSYLGLIAQVKVVPGPVDTEYYCPDLSVSRDWNTVLSVGRLLPHKGFERIIKALPDSLHLTIIGAGYDADYRAYLQELGRGKNVRIIEGLSDDEVRHCMRTAGLYVQASTHVDYRGTFYSKPELLGLASLEAMSTGCPTLVSNAGSLPELASIAGCSIFRDDDHLTQILASYSARLFDLPGYAVISRDVENKYGLKEFGRKFLIGARRLFK
jgi:glycosyltransferase involved in cell wall biosynthesis